MATKRPKKIEIKIEKKKKVTKIDGGVILKKKTGEDIEREKIFLMRIGITCVMIVFFVAWIFNLKYQFKISSDNGSRGSSFSWEQTRAELDKAMSQVKESLKEIKQTQETKQLNTLPREPELTSEQIDLLKGKLMNEIATSTAASTNK
jgi:hypothetical protein